MRGEVVITNLDALNLHIAREALANLDHIAALKDEQLERLRYQAGRVASADKLRSIDPRVTAEMRRRGMDSTGRRAAAQLRVAA